MAHTVITIARQIGSGGDVIAADLAHALGIQLIERQILEAAATAAGVSPDTIRQVERVPSFMERMLEYLGNQSVSTDPLVEMPVGGLVTAGGFNLGMTSDSYRDLLEQVVRKTAEETDSVILAYGGSVILREMPSVLRVLICAPVRIRTQRLAEIMKCSAEAAEQQVRDDDKARADYFQTYYKVNWTTPALYDLTINTARLSPMAAVEAIKTASSHMDRSDPNP